MTEHRSHEPERTADATQPRANTGGSAGDRPGGPVADREAQIFVNSETAMGGADAVQKTSYVVGSGTEPSAQARGDSTTHPHAGTGPNYAAWGIGAIAALVALVYLFGLLT